ncbi:MAG: proteasome subunit beta [Actinobacteria bacterium]|nr:proteasome subunit beta [Actinomycetota bacterium]
MALPVFESADDPGTDFSRLLSRAGVTQPAVGGLRPEDIPHATTCVALRFDGGVVMGGDRRATSGHLISHRSMEKVVQADSHSGVAIAGAAGPAVEMIKLFQVQLEYYEKVQGNALSLEGKANQLSSLVRSNLPGAMQGLGVVPIFAGFDTRRETGRLWDYDVLGGRYEERDHVATGSGSLHAGTVMKMGYRSRLDRDAAVALVCRSLWEAAEADSATGGPDMVRGIYPIVAVIDRDGWDRVGDAELEAVFTGIVSSARESSS